MDETTEIVRKFETILKEQNKTQTSALYSSRPLNNTKKVPSYNRQDILSNISKQLKAIQYADSFTSDKSASKKLLMYKESTFVPVNMLLMDEVPQKPQKFETQCVSDTQLIDIIQNAEDAAMIDADKGMTEEFESTFFQEDHVDDDVEDKQETMNLTQKDLEFPIIDISLKEPDPNLSPNIFQTPQDPENDDYPDVHIGITDNFKNVDTDVIDNGGTHTQILNESILIEGNAEQTYLQDKDVHNIPSSPIFNIKATVKSSKTPSPLVFNLDTFEKFENIAVPVLEHSQDFEMAKQLINSQLMSNELNIQTNTKPFLNIDAPISPVVPISNDKVEMVDSLKSHGEDILKLKDVKEEKLKDKFILEDEILFSSDEDDDYIHNELPFTCVLETSFYDQPDILDKTMYVAFQTASNKSIQICSGSFSRAKSILGEIEQGNSPREPTLTELVELNTIQDTNKDIKDANSKSKPIEVNVSQSKLLERELKLQPDTVDKISTVECEDLDIKSQVFQIKTGRENISQNCAKNEEYDEDFDFIPSKSKPIEEPLKLSTGDSRKRKFEGFVTASNKKIKLSDTALARSKKVFQDIDLEGTSSVQNKERDINIKLVGSPERDLPDIIAEDFKDILKSNTNKEEDEKRVESIEDRIPDTMVDEFKDPVSFPAKSDQDEFVETLKHTNIDDELIIKEFQNIEMDHTEFADKNEDNKHELDYVGFKTAIYKNIEISEVGMAKTKNVFQVSDLSVKGDISYFNTEVCDSEISTLLGFRTASNKRIKICDKALAKTKSIFHDIESLDFNNTEEDLAKTNDKKKGRIKGGFIQPTAPFVGFQTASNKAITISEAAVSKTKEIFQDIEPLNPIQTDNYDETKSQGFKTASYKDVPISNDNIVNSKRLFQDIEKKDFYKSWSNEKLKTARNKTVIPSDAAKNNFPSIDKVFFSKPIDEKCKSKEVKLQAFKTASNNNVLISNDQDINKTDNEAIENLNSDEEEPFYGFDATNNENIISTVIKSKTKKCLNMKFLNFEGLMTESHKPGSISTEALARSKKIVQDVPTNDNETNRRLHTDKTGFKSKYFTDETIHTCEGIDNPHKSSIVGFKTGNNTPVIISKAALVRSEKVFEGNCEAVINTQNCSFKGFQTARNKGIRISEDSLAKSRKIQDIEDYREVAKVTEPIFKGFQTASNKEVKISVDALAKSRKIFEDIDSCKEIEKVLEPTFKGFQAASNNRVKTSEHALAKNRKLFEEIDNNKEVAEVPEPKFNGFQTASNIKVKISEDALAKSRKLFEEIDNNKEVAEVSEPTFNGFQTASNKKVKISDDALAKSRKLFEEIDNSKEVAEVLEPTFNGFQTASNKKVKISEDALAKSRKLFEDIDNCKEVAKVTGPSTFKGFQTASNKEVRISEDALAESRKVFEGIDKTEEGFYTANNKQVDITKESMVKTRHTYQDRETTNKYVDEVEMKTSGKTKPVFGFKTGNDNIEVCKETLRKSHKLLSDFDESVVGTSLKNNFVKSVVETTKERHVVDIIDTQVLNNFDKSLHTEDFKVATPVKSKRSGSPILSCPRPKRRKKFETPYSQRFINNKEGNTVAISGISANTMKVPENVCKFDNNYKKTKKYSLKDLKTLEEQTKSNAVKIDPYITKLKFANLLNMEFSDERNDVTDKKWNVDDIKKYLLDSINKKLVPIGWIDNHMQLILWKLISYEIKFPNTLRKVCTVKNVLDQLKYRYDKELYNAERPALRKILEKDDVSTRTMVLAVVAVFEDGVKVTSATKTTNIEVLLTDGWYSVKACLDKMLSKLVYDQKIVVGTKIATNGAELVNCEQGVSPWEDTSAIRLKLYGNSSRRARWDARLGYHGNGAILSHLPDVKPEGGRVGKLRVFVARVYPPLYIEKFEDGSTVTRSERLENLHQMKYENDRQSLLEKLYEDVEKEFSDQSNLTDTQRSLLQDHTTRHSEKLLQSIQERVQQKMGESGLSVTRNVVPLLKVRVAGIAGREVTKAMLSIWKPNDAVLEMIAEGAWTEVLNVVPTAVRYSEMQISAGRQSVFIQSQYKEPDHIKPYTKSLKRTCYAIKDLVKNPTMTTDYNEIDTVGLIFQIDPPIQNFNSSKHQFQNVYLTDADKNIICINLWGGLKKFGYENVLDTGHIVSGSNLQKRAGNTRKNIPQYRVTEFTYFTKTPKNENARRIIEELSKKLTGFDKAKFFEECVTLKNGNFTVKLHNNYENISPYRFQNVFMNMSKNKMFIDSPLALKPNKNDENLNLTGLDFESTFKQTQTQELSPQILLRKRQVKEKIAKLKMYGEPPPLSYLNIMNKSKNAGSAYKSPLNSKSDVSTCVASEEKILPIEKKSDVKNDDIQCSPVILNRTFVKRTNVNPVKLNFSSPIEENNTSEAVDDFADDFDGSPPLSLD